MSANTADTATPYQWQDCHRCLVEIVFKTCLRRMPEEVEDAIQHFWMWFFETGQDGKFDPGRNHEAFVRLLANRRAIDWFRCVLRRRGRLQALDDKDFPAEGPQEATPELWLVGYFCDLVATNHLEAHMALVMVCKDWFHSGPVALADKYADHTLFQLCSLVRANLEESGDEVQEAFRLIDLLQQQLGLPPDRPQGELRLDMFVKEMDASGGKDRDMKSALHGWLDQARRICIGEIKSRNLEDSRQIALEVRARVREDLRQRLDFIVESLTRKRDPEKFLVWGWLRLLRLAFEYFYSFACNQAAQWFTDRMRFLVPQYVFPDGLANCLAGKYPDHAISETLIRLETSPEQIGRAVEGRFKRFLDGRS
jgi:hypothetical protein